MCTGKISPGPLSYNRSGRGLRIKVFKGGEIIQFLGKSRAFHFCMDAIVMRLRTH